ncbi:MAG: glycosyltransferase family 2 protein, partial [Parachlamydiales bacterium]|nr:glycosyltransferase family 2 protein [Parachlamydiales bacterium]
MAPKLSICIPTYNRENCLRQALDSILSQEIQGIEIVISDNASADQTIQLIEDFKKKGLDIVLHVWPKNMGADRNFLKVIEIATGDYCWLLSSDDILEPGSIKAVQNILANHSELTGVTVASSYTYDIDLKERISDKKVFSYKQDVIFDNAETCYANLGHYLGFISAQIINRKLWNDVIAHEKIDDYLSGYVHLYVIGKMLKNNPKWYFLSQGCVGWRANNDSFSHAGLYRRIEIDVKGFERIARDIFGKGSKVYWTHLKHVIREYVSINVIGVRIKD